ncbi:hypothetical protein ACFL96_05175 [Thermoproteota archaeon]
MTKSAKDVKANSPQQPKDRIAMEAAVNTTPKRETTFRPLDELLNIHEAVVLPFPSVHKKEEPAPSSLAQAYLENRLYLTPEDQVVESRKDDFRKLSKHSFGGYVGDGRTKTDPLTEEVMILGRPSEMLNFMKEQYDEFAAFVTPAEFEKLQKHIYDPFKGPFSEEAWDIQARKMFHVKKDDKGREYNVPFTDEEYAQSSKGLEEKKRNRLNEVLSNIRYAKVHEKIVSHLARSLREDGTDLDYVRNYVKNRVDSSEEQEAKTQMAQEIALLDIIDNTLFSEENRKRVNTCFERVFVKENRPADYLAGVEAFVRKELNIEGATNAFYRKKFVYKKPEHTQNTLYN